MKDFPRNDSFAAELKLVVFAYKSCFYKLYLTKVVFHPYVLDKRKRTLLVGIEP